MPPAMTARIPSPNGRGDRAGTRVAAFFDIDGTLARGQLLTPVIPLFYRWGYLTRTDIAKTVYRTTIFKLGLLRQRDIDRMWEDTLEFLKGRRRDDVAAVMARGFREAGRSTIRSAARLLVEEHRREGHEVHLATSQTEEASAPLASWLGLDGVVATRLEARDGVYTGRFVDGYCYGPRKAEAVERFSEARGIDLAACWFYSDALVDLPLLERVAHPVAVNPERALARVARERGWRILTFG